MAPQTPAAASPSACDDERLLIEAAKIDPLRFADLYERHFDRVYGNTVNHAARIEGQSKGADVVMTGAIARDPEVVKILGAGDVLVSGFETALKGLTGTHRLTRLELTRRF